MTTKTLQKKESRFTSNINGKIVRHEGKVYRIIVHNLGRFTLADAEEVNNKTLVNLFDRTALAKALREKIEQGIYS